MFSILKRHTGLKSKKWGSAIAITKIDLKHAIDDWRYDRIKCLKVIDLLTLRKAESYK
jgi:hypothetical protein